MKTNNLQAMFEAATKSNCIPARIAIEAGVQWRNPDLWYQPKLDTIDDDYIDVPDFIPDGLLGEYSRAIAKTIQFPPNTVFTHALGCAASALNMNFWHKYYNAEMPVNLYVITSQPPATGKSGVNDYLTNAISDAYMAVTATNKLERPVIEKRIKKATDELDKAKTDHEIRALVKEIEEENENLKKYPLYLYTIEDATPEALEALAFSQNGVFNMVSDEATAVNSVLGMLYSDKASNNGVVLKGWDGGNTATIRVGRGVTSGYVRGVFSVIAQDETIRSILSAGLRGNGVSERFLMLRERHLLGQRVHGEYIPIAYKLRDEYEKTISNIVSSPKTVLTLSKEALELIIGIKNKYEPDLADNGKYCHALMRGVVGKADKQIIKIASILHAFEEWRPYKSKNTEIQFETVRIAWRIFENLIVAYENAASSNGYSGLKAEMKAVMETINNQIERKRDVISLSSLRDLIKNKPVFKSCGRLTARLKDVVLPALEDDDCIVFHGGTIYFNPKLKGGL